MPRMDVQRTGYNDAVNVFHVEQAAMIIECLNARHLALGLVAATAVDVGHGHQLHIRHVTNLSQQVVAPVSYSDHAHPYPVIGPQHCGRGIGQHRRRADCRLLQKNTPRWIVHNSPSATARLTVPEASSSRTSSHVTILPASRPPASVSPGLPRNDSRRSSTPETVPASRSAHRPLAPNRTSGLSLPHLCNGNAR